MQKGLNHDGMQRANRSLVFGILADSEMLSRSELAYMTGLRKATITNIINEFLDVGIIRESDVETAKGTRKTEGLILDVPKVKILSARITRSFFTVQMYDLRRNLIDEETCRISVSEDIHVNSQRVYETIDMLLARHNIFEVLGMCIGIPGPYIRGEHNVALVTGFENLRKIDFQKEFEERYPFPIFTEHDAKLSAFAEWKNLDNTIRSKESCLLGIQSIGIGIGAGIIVDGKILHGGFGVAGEIGQMGINFNGPLGGYSNRGTLETYASTENIKQYVLERLYEFPDSVLSEKSSYCEIKKAYYEEDPLAICAFDNLAWKLAYGLVNAIFFINPNRIVIGTDYPGDDRFLNKVKESVRKMIYPELYNCLTIQLSNLNIDSTLLGGNYFVIEKFVNDKTIFERIKAILEDSIR